MVRLQPGAKWHEGEHEPLGRSGEPCFWSYKGSEASFRDSGSSSSTGVWAGLRPNLCPLRASVFSPFKGAGACG